MQLTQKEKELIKDLRNEEQLCVDKYTRHSSAAVDPQLKNLFSQIAQDEQKHLDAIDKLSQGTISEPFTASGTMPTFEKHYTAETPDKQADTYLCSDVLATEKHASALYDTCVFEFNDQNARILLESIQKQEQNHGKMIYDYMAANCMQ